MKLKIFLLFNIIVGLYFIALAQVITGETWTTLLKENRNGEFSSLKDFAIVENIPLVGFSENIPKEYAAVASILRYYEINSLAQVSFLDANDFIKREIRRIVEDNLDIESEAQKVKLQEEICENFNKFRRQGIATNVKKTLPETDGKILMNLLYYNSHDLKTAVEDILHRHSYVPKFRIEPCEEQIGQILLKLKIPFALRFNKHVYLCIGYFNNGAGNNYLICDLADIKPEKVSYSIYASRRGLMSTMSSDKILSREDDPIFRLSEAKPPQYIKIINWPPIGDIITICFPCYDSSIIRKIVIEHALKLNIKAL